MTWISEITVAIILMIYLFCFFFSLSFFFLGNNMCSNRHVNLQKKFFYDRRQFLIYLSTFLHKVQQNYSTLKITNCKLIYHGLFSHYQPIVFHLSNVIYTGFDLWAKVTEFIRMLWNIVSKLGKVYEVYPVLKVSLENQLA